MVNLVIPESNTRHLKNVHVLSLSVIMRINQDIYYTGTRPEGTKIARSTSYRTRGHNVDSMSYPRGHGWLTWLFRNNHPSPYKCTCKVINQNILIQKLSEVHSLLEFLNLEYKRSLVM